MEGLAAVRSIELNRPHNRVASERSGPPILDAVRALAPFRTLIGPQAPAEPPLGFANSIVQRRRDLLESASSDAWPTLDIGPHMRIPIEGGLELEPRPGQLLRLSAAERIHAGDMVQLRGDGAAIRARPGSRSRARAYRDSFFDGDREVVMVECS